ncbi:MAG TPA: hypothetical protein PK096_01415 [Candidatus Saccharibacteria bacterium]|nr:hypothetical protein [Candidatus Saccharibacteria bacterium]HRK94008.1 hypothetical protein [Candidatus Saccharibacteria bacterium]
MKRLRNLLITLGLIGGLSFAVAVPAGAINVIDNACKGGNKDTAVCKAQGDTAGPLVRSIINILLFVVGVISVIMIIVGGIRYTISNGDASQIKSAKDTVLYSVVGLVVAMLAYAIVNYVIAQF